MTKGVANTKPNYTKILNLGIELTKIHGLNGIRVQMIGKGLNCHHTLFYTYFPSMKFFIDKVIEKAIKENIFEIIIDGFLKKRINKDQLTDEMQIKLEKFFEK